MTKLNILVATALALLISACSGGGGGSASPTPTPPPLVIKKYPSALNSIYESNKTFITAGQQTTLTITTKDQTNADITLSPKWVMAIQVTCQNCEGDSSQAVSLFSSSKNVYKYRFTPAESATYAVEVIFYPSNSYTAYNTDFPNGVDPESLYALALNIPGYDMCNEPADPSLHGLRGSQMIANVNRLMICDSHDLALIADDTYFLDKDLYLAKNINLADYYQNSGEEFSIGNDCSDSNNCNIFSGTFYGNNKTISNFKRTTGLGLFGTVVGNGSCSSCGTIQYFTLDNSTQSGVSGGGIAYGLSSYAKIIGVHVTNSTLSGSETVGGLVGLMEDSYIIASSSASSAISSKNIVGGLVGLASSLMANSSSSSVIKTSSSSATVKMENMIAQVDGNFAGGLVGKSDSHMDVYDCYFTGNVSSESSAGGLVGKLYGTISTSYVSGQVTGQLFTGGLIGETDPLYANTVNKSFINPDVNGGLGVKGSVAGNCNQLNTNKFFINSSLSECGTQSSYISTEVSVGNHPTIPSLSAALRPILTNWAWDPTVWIITTESLPVIH